MKKALITGAGRGIGRATALALAGMGYEIYANYVGNTQAAEETKALIEKNGGVCTLVKYDLCKTDCAHRHEQHSRQHLHRKPFHHVPPSVSD